MIERQKDWAIYSLEYIAVCMQKQRKNHSEAVLESHEINAIWDLTILTEGHIRTNMIGIVIKVYNIKDNQRMLFHKYKIKIYPLK